jgi:F-type H+-transporting ATPase subunit a
VHRNIVRIVPVLFIVASLLQIQPARASQDHHDGHGETEEQFVPTEMIMHHIADAHDWHLWDWQGHPVSIPLPVIVYSNGQLDVFLSSAFHHGEHSVTIGNNEYTLNHGHIEEVSGHPVYDFSITRNVASMLVVSLLMFLIFVGSARAYQKSERRIPAGIAKFTEPLILYVKDEIAIPSIGEAKYKRFMPYLLTVFFFIWINNLLGLIPFFPGGSNVTGNIAVTMTLAAFTMILTNINGSKYYWQHTLWMPGIPVPVRPILTIIEVAGIFIKPVALMIRLFANITAGHIIILSLISLIFIFQTSTIALVSVPFAVFMNILELLVAALQAFIFTLLSALFIGIAMEDHHEEHETA